MTECNRPSAVLPSARLQSISALLENTAAKDENSAHLSIDKAINLAAGMVIRCRHGHHKIMVIGNGGSAAIASHLQNDLSKAVGARTLGFQATPILTAYANDEGYDKVYIRQVETWADQGDLLIAISSSGRSANILAAADAALAKGCELITLTGFDEGNPLGIRGHVNLHIASHEYGLVEASHAVLAHVLSDQACDLAQQKEQT